MINHLFLMFNTEFTSENSISSIITDSQKYR